MYIYTQIFDMATYCQIIFSFSIIGIIFYLLTIFLLFYYYKCPFFIKEEIFTFIFINSISSILILYIEDEMFRYLSPYASKIVLFCLFLIYVDKYLSKTEISKNLKNIEINDKLYIILIYVLSSFPFDYFLHFNIYEMFIQFSIKIILSIALYKKLKAKFELLINNLQNLKIKDNRNLNLYSIEKIDYYINAISTVKNIYSKGCFFFVGYLSLYLMLLYRYYEFLRLLILAVYSIFNACIIIGSLLFFYTFNKTELEKKLKRVQKREKNSIIIKIYNREDIEVLSKV